MMEAQVQIKPAILPFEGEKSVVNYVLTVQPTMVGQVQAQGDIPYQRHVVLAYRVTAEGTIERIPIPFNQNKRFFIMKSGPESFVATTFGIFSNFVLSKGRVQDSDLHIGISITASYRNPISVTNTAPTGLGAYVTAIWEVTGVTFAIPILTLARDEEALDQILASDSEETLQAKVVSVVNTLQALAKQSYDQIKENADFKTAIRKLAVLDPVSRLRAVAGLYRQTKHLRQGPPDSPQLLLERLVSAKKNTNVVLDLD